MKRVIAAIFAILLNVLVITILLTMAENQEQGKDTNIMKSAGQTSKQMFLDFKEGWAGPEEDSTQIDTTQVR
jgi:type II secretory pathway pseudopilin PulG